MNKSFTLRTLSLAIVIASGSVNAETPKDCVSDNGTGETLKEWGIWCGVETFLTTLTEQAPPAAGPAETEVDVALDEIGRGDAEEFDPDAVPTATEPPPTPEPPPIPEPEPEPELVEPHIVLNDEGQGYIVSYDMDFSENGGSVPQVATRAVYDEGGGNTLVNPRVGSLSLSVADVPCSDDCYELSISDYGEGQDTANYVIFNQQGNEVERDDYEGYSRESGPTSSSSKRADVYTYDDDGEQFTDFYLYQRFYESEELDDGGNRETSQRFNASGLSLSSDFEHFKARGERSYFNDFLLTLWEQNDSINTSQLVPDTDFFEYTRENTGLRRRSVSGSFSPLAELASLNSGNVQAYYGGFTSFLAQSVAITVDFGAATFESQFGDRPNFFLGFNMGEPEDFDFSFEASGVIQGTELISTSVSTDSGFVQGSFFEPRADLIGGAYQVTKAGFEYADVFAAIRNFVEPHIDDPYYGGNQFIGYYAGFDFDDDVVEDYETGPFELSVQVDEYESFNGYAGNQYFGESTYDDSVGCPNDEGCNRTNVFLPSEEAKYFTHEEQSRAPVETNTWEGYEATADNGDTEQLLVDYWNGYHVETQNDDTSTDSQERAFIAGVITPLVEINQLISDQRTLIYTGNSLNLLQSARVEVDFGNELFEAQFGDVDGAKKARLGIDASKDMSFDAAGVVSGAKLISTSVSADSGFVEASFFGPQAEVVGGVYDVTKGGDRIVDVFSAAQGAGNAIKKVIIPQ